MSEKSLEEIRDSLKLVLAEFGPQQLTDGAHEYFCCLLDMVEACIAEEDEG